MRVLVAPDKFRGTLSAPEAARAIEAGWRRRRPEDDLDLTPIADGGEGTLDALVAATGGRLRSVEVRGPLGDPVPAAFGLLGGAERGTAAVEMAMASGLALLAESRRDPRRTTTAGTGDLIRAALDEGVARIVVCLGGSATNDGGTGMASALGVRFLDDEGRNLEPGGAALTRLARIDASGLDPRVARVGFLGATDVTSPLTGPQGASAVFGPQKGASPEDVHLLDRALARLAVVAERDLGGDWRDEPGAGAAGGLGFGLLAFCGAHLRPGAEVVADALGLESRVGTADLVVTGEGAFDATSVRGKAPGAVLALARLHGRRAAVLCGRAATDPPPGVTVRSLVEVGGAERALSEARRVLEEAAEELAAGFGDVSGTDGR
jgi:glycerate kinase